MDSPVGGLVLMLLRGAQIFNFAEYPNSNGRSDLEVLVERKHWVFEFKFIPNKERDKAPVTQTHEGEAKERTSESRPVVQGEITKLAEALEQMRARQYGVESLFDGDLISVALVFSEKDRRFVEWETYPLSGKEESLARPGWAEALASALRDGQKWEESLLLPLQKEGIENVHRL